MPCPTQLHDRKGKHGAAVTCGDWLSDNRLGLASGTQVKISKPLPQEGAQWESYSKFKLSGMLSRVPRKFKDAGAPKLLSFSLSYPPFVAVCIGDNYMLVFGTTGSHNNEVRLPELPSLAPLRSHLTAGAEGSRRRGFPNGAAAAAAPRRLPSSHGGRIARSAARHR